MDIDYEKLAKALLANIASKEEGRLTDAERLEFIRALDNSERVTVSIWEASFIDWMLLRGIKNDEQRAVIDQMVEKYDV